ncbi:MAG: S-layer protein domain-containing protein [Candidatus Methanoperedens sp.]
MKKVVFLLALSIALLFIHVGDAQFEQCMLCHKFNMGVYPAINETLFGSHRNVNTTDGVGNISDSDCIVCHYNTSLMLVPGFTVSTYLCEDCHVNGVVSSPRVNNHLRNGNISVSVNCFDCHNKTTTLFEYNANASAAHYGINASFGLPTGNQYCAYCHQNSTTAYSDVMQNASNSMLGIHTSDVVFTFPAHPAGLPSCTRCHGQDKLHGTNISKPVPSSDFCLKCHSNDRLKKDKHDGKVECIRCHTEKPSDVHNIKYILPDGSYRGINATSCGDCHDFSLPLPSFRLPFLAANCTTCHQNGGLANFSEAPSIPAPVKHSANPNSGALWNGSQQAYWDNTALLSSCNYCHGNATHASKALGKIENIRSGNMPNQSITSTSYWCANCHYNKSNPAGNYLYNGTSYSPVPPEIQNMTGMVPATASDNTTFFNHSLDKWSDSICVQCHGNSSPSTTAYFVHSIVPARGGPDCISCHNVSATGAPLDKRVNVLAFNISVHSSLNGGGNRACWACHGNGSEPSSGHPPEYKSPKRCSSNDCHSLNQTYRAPMIYSHFRNASLNSNPNNVVNFNVTTTSNCQECHNNSINAIGKNMNSTVSHYASLDELPDSINCKYCHLNKNNSEKWGNATLIYKNRTDLVELDKEKNKFTVKSGDFIDLGFRFRLRLLEVSSGRESALIELSKDGKPVDRALAGIGNYTYEEYLAVGDSNSVAKSPVIVLNITGIFKDNNGGFIQFEGFRLERVHAENKDTECYLCHLYLQPKLNYRVIDRVNRTTDVIFLARELVNMTDKKAYNESTALGIISNLTDTDLNVNIESGRSKSLLEGETWNISGDVSVLVKEVSIQSDEALLMVRAGDYSYENFVKKGDVFEFSPPINYLGYVSKNVTVFRANISGIIQARPKNMVILKDVVALSPVITGIDVNETIEGYNASWLWENSTFTVGKIPENFHSPQLFSGRDGGGDCLTCHGSNGFVQGKIITSLGMHETLNGGGNNVCHACHGGIDGAKTHPTTYKTPRPCLSCHGSLTDNYSAPYIGDEPMRNDTCQNCHVVNTHDIIKLFMLPAVKDISLLKEGNRTTLKALAVAGNEMKVRGARYYIDSPDEMFNMSPADGAFDSQNEEVFAYINVSKIAQGKHTVYVESMERNNKWGDAASLAFTLEDGNLSVEGNKKSGMGSLPLLGILAAFLIRWYRASSRRR